MHVWPAHPRPQPDELLSSWLTRVAMANGQKLSCIFHVGTGSWVPVIQKYIDSSLPIETLSGLEDHLDISLDMLYDMMLYSYAGRVYEQETSHSKRMSGILNAGETRHHLYFQQYCPECLKGPIPYYRKVWRLSCMTICPLHKCKLLDRCSHCEAPVLVVGNDSKDKHMPYAGEFTDCHQCGENLGCVASEQADSRVINEAVFYRLILNSGFALFHRNESWTYSFVFFSLVRLLMKLVYGRICISSGRKASSPDIDSIGCAGRYLAAKVICGAFDRWPDSFVDLCKLWSIRYYELETIQKTLGYVPFLLERDVKPLLYKPNLPPSRESVLSAIRVMRKQNLRVNQTTLNHFMGYRYSGQIIEVLKQECFL